MGRKLSNFVMIMCNFFFCVVAIAVNIYFYLLDDDMTETHEFASMIPFQR